MIMPLTYTIDDEMDNAGLKVRIAALDWMLALARFWLGYTNGQPDVGMASRYIRALCQFDVSGKEKVPAFMALQGLPQTEILSEADFIAQFESAVCGVETPNFRLLLDRYHAVIADGILEAKKAINAGKYREGHELRGCYSCIALCGAVGSVEPNCILGDISGALS
ncbi:hypothetical protein [Chitiniphilus eburneus]|uniref:Uncharacterized protein n=1 Tax=Chitiniphilus eburneus TaxID=2571148 RepID=A0A4U0PFY1_9NEIS|nr:hypothetical protein [Chitiniphilus eburneus]TJZ66846.1 hypothetical protein FAZ21_16820 [Chitiniphilus eburneus]